MQRFRITFGRDDRLKYISHLDTMRLWERVFRRAGIALAYSEGFNPHPKLSTAMPLAVGTTSDCELLDVLVEATTPVATLIDRVRAQLPPGLVLSSAAETDLSAPALASVLRQAEYEAILATDVTASALHDRLTLLLAAESLPRERIRDGKIKRYDLRPLIDDLRLITAANRPPCVWMRLQAGPMASGRPEEVTAAMGIESPPRSIKRVGLIFQPKA